MPINSQATELNEILCQTNAHAHNMLSSRGKAIFFPKLGILSQSAEAAGKNINATIGTALEDDGLPMCLEVITDQFNNVDTTMFNYAPSPGRPDIRANWKSMQLSKNPSLAGVAVSSPVVTCALTHGLSMAGYLFVNEGDTLILPDLYWENYDLIFSNAYGANIVTYPAFAGGGYNIEGLRSALASVKTGKKIVLLNFPNNPTGYTATISEGKEISALLTQEATLGTDLVVLVDDAYFGLGFEENCMPESIFVQLAQAHERLLAVKLDGPTKEDYVWGFRVGFVTFGIKGGTDKLYNVLEGKLAGAIRGNISNAPNPGQMLLVKAWKDPRYAAEKDQKYTTLNQRYHKVKQILGAHPEYAAVYDALPFNSGYFMCVKVKKGNAEEIRQKLIKEYSTGIIAFGAIIRVAFSATPIDKLELLFENIYKAGLAA